MFKSCKILSKFFGRGYYRNINLISRLIHSLILKYRILFFNIFFQNFFQIQFVFFFWLQIILWFHILNFLIDKIFIKYKLIFHLFLLIGLFLILLILQILELLVVKWFDNFKFINYINNVKFIVKSLNYF
jgi:hypothetical protein